MISAFQPGAFQVNAYQAQSGSGPVWPTPPQVLLGVVYGPNGNDYTGTLTGGQHGNVVKGGIRQ